MIIIIGGPSCTGKTLLAQKLLEKYRIQTFSEDNLKMGMFRSDAECPFTPMDSNEKISNHIWPIVREIIKTSIENGRDMIVEGCYHLTEQVEELEEYLSDVIEVYIGFSESYIRNNFDAMIQNKGAIEAREANDERPIEQFIDEHNTFIEACGQKIFIIDDNYSEGLDDIETYIEEEMRKRSEL